MTRLRNERGAVELFVALSLVVILGITALVVDIGNAKQTRRNFQTAADSGSLAGAQQLPAATTAQNFAAEYSFDSMNQPRPSGNPPGQTTCPGSPYPAAPSASTVCYLSSGGAYVYVTTPYTFTPAGSASPISPTSEVINVRVCQKLSTSFARVLKINSTMVCNNSTSVNPSTGNCVVCIMSTKPGCALSVGGSVDINVVGNPPGPVTVNSPDPNALCVNGNPTVTTPGGLQWVGCSSTCPQDKNWTPDPVHGPAVQDPLADVPVPSVSASGSCTSTGGGNQTCTPGIYTNAPNLTNGTTTLSSGIYIIEQPINIQNQNTLVSGPGGVMLYFTCAGYSSTNTSPCTGAQNETGGGISGNNGSVTLSALTAGPYAGLLIFADRNFAGSLMSGQGNTTYNLTGTIYGLNASIDFGGTEASVFDSRLVVGTLSLQGNPSINENYADQFQGLPTSGGVALVG